MKFIQRSLILLLFYLTLWGLSQPVLAIPIQEIPNPKVLSNSWVMDKADILTPVTENHLNREISQLEQANGSEIAIVTVPDTKPEATPKQFATKLFNTWGIGKKETNNGVLFLISQRDRRVEIETGTGLGEILPDREVGKIIEQKIIPDFQQGNFDRGTVSGTEAMIEILQQQPNPQNLSPVLSDAMVVWVFILFAIAMTILSNLVHNKRMQALELSADLLKTRAKRSRAASRKVPKTGKRSSTKSQNNSSANTDCGDSSVGFSDGGGGSFGGDFGGGCSDGGGAGGHW